jgi:hypothetical protein
MSSKALDVQVGRDRRRILRWLGGFLQGWLGTRAGRARYSTMSPQPLLAVFTLDESTLAYVRCSLGYSFSGSIEPPLALSKLRRRYSDCCGGTSAGMAREHEHEHEHEHERPSCSSSILQCHLVCPSSQLGPHVALIGPSARYRQVQHRPYMQVIYSLAYSAYYRAGFSAAYGPETG